VGTPGRAALVAVLATLILAVVPCSIAGFAFGFFAGAVATGGHDRDYDERGPRYGPGPGMRDPKFDRHPYVDPGVPAKPTPPPTPSPTG
jgi:hypothetical protein